MIQTATIQFQYHPERTVLTFARRVRLQAAGDADGVREHLISPTHCSCAKTRKVPSRPDSMHTS